MTTATRTAERTDFLASIITLAVEGGINYWAEDRDYKFKWVPEGRRALAHASVDVREHGKMQWHTISLDTIEAGIARIMLPDFEINKTLLTSILVGNRNSDAGELDTETADCIVQAALFGRLVYG